MPHPIDIFVGSRVKLFRIRLGLSQSALSKKIGVSFQQIQKYESGHNRISASTLFLISAILGISPNLLFPQEPDDYSQYSEFLDKNTYFLLRNFEAINSRDVQIKLLSLIQKVSSTSSTT